MASGSRGGNGSADPKVRGTLSRKPTMLDVPQEEEAPLLADSELVPLFLSSVVPHPTRRQRDRDPQPSRRPPLSVTGLAAAAIWSLGQTTADLKWLISWILHQAIVALVGSKRISYLDWKR
ncbi:hypothetical protein OPV22_006953 [Ensete ventricosum]|uniref:Uncharacterized protein n=1 Tax=Ensete ventricosum TaxID=4639 RepID=A0AAV8Q5P9_ENSVE|nr:hypothetical protein OPV22_006953 [Ensete ventricosum]